MHGVKDIARWQGNFFIPHTHDKWEIVYYTSGSGVNIIGNKELPFSEGTIICQPPKIMHEERSVNGYANIFMRVDKMDDFEMDIPVFQDTYNRDIGQIFAQLLNCFHLHENNWRNIANSLICTATEYMYSRKTVKQKNSYVEMCEGILIDNISNIDFSVAKLICEIPMAETYFMKLFKKETSYTPLEYLTQKRIEHAKRLLLNNWRVKDVAIMCGYKDPYYFSRVFKKHVGHSPTMQV